MHQISNLINNILPAINTKQSECETHQLYPLLHTKPQTMPASFDGSWAYVFVLALRPAIVRWCSWFVAKFRRYLVCDHGYHCPYHRRLVHRLPDSAYHMHWALGQHAPSFDFGHPSSSFTNKSIDADTVWRKNWESKFNIRLTFNSFHYSEAGDAHKKNITEWQTHCN